MPARMEFEYRFGRAGARKPPRKRQDGPLRILVLGDLRGDRRQGDRAPETDLVSRPVVPVDVDNFDAVMARLAPRLSLPGDDPAGPDLALQFKSLDDFHPDALYARLELFKTLRRTRQRLLDPATSGEVIAELSPSPATARTQSKPGPESTGGGPSVAKESTEGTLDRLLGKRPAGIDHRRGLGRAQDDVAAFIERVVRPHIVPDAPPEQEPLLASLDQATGVQMRRILHHPGFQQLEAAWRSVHQLVTNLETGEELKLYLVDVTRRELQDDIGAAGADLERSALYRLLVEKGTGTLGGEPWSLLVGNYTFGPQQDDIALLAALGAIASQAGGPFLAGADPRAVGCQSLVESADPKTWTDRDPELARGWSALRKSSSAPWIGLALPRFLVRLPYGPGSDEVERFAFDELAGGREHESFLWGNPAFACARLIGTSFAERGWSMQPGDHLDVGDLPAHTYNADGESGMTPCAEVELSERAAEATLGHGVMPLLSFRNRNAARLLRFQSLADPPAALSGPWR